MARKTSRRPRVLPDDACHECGTMMREQKSTLKLPVNGEQISVPRMSHLACPKCREKVLRLDEARQLHQQALAIYRRKYGLLSSEEIRAVRERLELTQGQFARLLKLGKNTLSRWEAGRNVQSASMDLLLRLIRDVPASLHYLRKRAA